MVLYNIVHITWPAAYLLTRRGKLTVESLRSRRKPLKGFLARNTMPFG